jgi:hypothetical protein
VLTKSVARRPPPPPPLMQASQRRAEVLRPLRDRVCKVAGSRLEERLALQLSIACAMRESGDLVEFIAPRHVAAAVLERCGELAMTPEEWGGVFGHHLVPLREGGVAEAVRSSEFVSEIEALGEALRCTVSEPEQGSRYARAWGRALCYVGMHLSESDLALESVLGNVVRADGRRIEEMRERLDTDGSNTILIAKIIQALSDSVV